jgi:hypothetical protein
MATPAENGERAFAAKRGRFAQLCRALLLLVPVLSFSACNFIDLDRELKELEKFSSI